MDAVLIIIAALTAGAPMIAAVIVSVASRREDNEWTLGDRQVGPVRTIARRILDFHTDDTEWTQPRSRTRSRTRSRSRAPSRAQAPGALLPGGSVGRGDLGPRSPRAPDGPELDPGWEPADADPGRVLLASR